MKKITKKNIISVLKSVGKVFRLGSIQSIMAFSFIFITISAMLFTGLVLYNKFSSISEKNALMSSSQTLEQVKVSLEYYLKGMVEVSDSMADENGIINFDGKDKISDVFRLSLKLRKDIVTLAIFTENGELVAASSNDSLKKDIDMKDEEWFKNLYRDKLSLRFSSPHVQNLFRSQHKWVVSLSKQISYRYKNELKKGISLVDKVALTGLGLPSEMADYIEKGICQWMYLWNPIDVGYLAGYTADALVKGTITGKAGEKFTAGKLGDKSIITVGDGTEIMLGDPFKFDSKNIGEWKKIY